MDKLTKHTQIGEKATEVKPEEPALSRVVVTFPAFTPNRYWAVTELDRILALLHDVRRITASRKVLRKIAKAAVGASGDAPTMFAASADLVSYIDRRRGRAVEVMADDALGDAVAFDFVPLPDKPLATGDKAPTGEHVFAGEPDGSPVKQAHDMNLNEVISNRCCQLAATQQRQH